MKFKTSTGAILEPKSQEVEEQMIKAGYEVVNEESTSKATKASKKVATEEE